MRKFKFRAWNKKTKKMVNNFHETYMIEDINDSETYDVMQFTDKVDINNKPIYEGDIIRERVLDFYYVDIVIWSKSLGSFRCQGVGETDYEGGIYEYDSQQIEIIGNIYENPELLEEY